MPLRRSLAGLLTLVALLATSAPALAQTPTEVEDSGEPDLRLVVSEMSSVLGPGAVAEDQTPPEDLRFRLLVENEGDGPARNVLVFAQVYDPPPEGARSNLHAALDDGDLHQFDEIAFARVEVDEEIPPGGIIGVEITIPADQIRGNWGERDAVHPVELTANLGSGGPDDRIVTAVMYLTARPLRPLHTTVVLPLEMEHERSAAGTYESLLPNELAPRGRLDTLVTLGQQLGDQPVLLAPDAASVEELIDRADGFTLDNGTEVTEEDPAAVHAGELLERLRDTVQNAAEDPVVGAYADVDVAALAAGPEPVSGLATTALEMERSRTRSLLGRSPDQSTYLSTVPLTPRLVEQVPAQRLLLPHADIRSDSTTETRAHRVVEGAEGRQLEAIVSDPHVTEILANPPDRHGSVVARQRLLAETALLWLASPSIARPLLVLPPPGWSPSAAMVRPMLTALLAAPWITTEPITADPVSEVSGRCVQAGTRSPCVDLSTAAASLPASVTGHLIEARRLIDALRAAVPEDAVVLGDRSIAELDDALLRAITPAARESGGQNAVQEIVAVKDVVDRAFGSIDVVEGPDITLTSSTGNVPVTISRESGGPIRVMIKVESSAPLVWEEGSQQEDVQLAAGTVQTVSFQARALGRGQFPVTVSVWDPTDSKMLDSATLSVRSTAISKPALVVIGVIVAALLLAGVRRRRRPRLEVVS